MILVLSRNRKNADSDLVYIVDVGANLIVRLVDTVDIVREVVVVITIHIVRFIPSNSVNGLTCSSLSPHSNPWQSLSVQQSNWLRTKVRSCLGQILSP